MWHRFQNFRFKLIKDFYRLLAVTSCIPLQPMLSAILMSKNCWFEQSNVNKCKTIFTVPKWTYIYNVRIKSTRIGFWKKMRFHPAVCLCFLPNMAIKLRSPSCLSRASCVLLAHVHNNQNVHVSINRVHMRAPVLHGGPGN